MGHYNSIVECVVGLVKIVDIATAIKTNFAVVCGLNWLMRKKRVQMDSSLDSFDGMWL